MAPSNEYNLASTGGGGKLKLKGAKVAGGRVEKKKGKKKRKKVEEPQEKEEGQDQEQERREVRSKSRGLSEEKGAGSQDEAGGSGDGDDDDDDDEKEKGVVVGKTEAEKRYEEVRKKRLDERLKREGIKTHKERVEELNKYLSTLSEHHDMPRIGPG